MEYVYSLNQDHTLNLSYGVTKLKIQIFHPKGMRGKVLAYHNDLTLKRVFQTEDILKYECQLYGASKTYQASLYLQLKREGDAMPKYNVFAELATMIRMNKDANSSQFPDNKTTAGDDHHDEHKDSESVDIDPRTNQPLPSLSLISLS